MSAQSSTSPPIQLFLTSIASQPALRQRQEYLLRTLQVKKIKFSSYDLASDERAKSLWKRKAPVDKQQLPGILVGGYFVGGFVDFEEAVEHDELEDFLRLSERYHTSLEQDRPILPTQIIAVPGVHSPKQMTPDRLKSAAYASTSSPLKGKGKVVVDGTHGLTSELPGFGHQSVQVSDAEINALIAELGLEGDDAKSLARSISISSKNSRKEKAIDPVTDKQPNAGQAVVDELKLALGRKPSKVANTPVPSEAEEAAKTPSEPTATPEAAPPATTEVLESSNSTPVEVVQPKVLEQTPVIVHDNAVTVSPVEASPPMENVLPALAVDDTTAPAAVTTQPEPFSMPEMAHSTSTPSVDLSPSGLAAALAGDENHKESEGTPVVSTQPEPVPPPIPEPVDVKEVSEETKQEDSSELIKSTPEKVTRVETPSAAVEAKDFNDDHGITFMPTPKTPQLGLLPSPSLQPRVSSFASPISPSLAASIPVPVSPGLSAPASPMGSTPGTPTGSIRGLNFRKKSKIFQSTVTQDERPVIESAEMSSKENK